MSGAAGSGRAPVAGVVAGGGADAATLAGAGRRPELAGSAGKEAGGGGGR